MPVPGRLSVAARLKTIGPHFLVDGQETENPVTSGSARRPAGTALPGWQNDKILVNGSQLRPNWRFQRCWHFLVKSRMHPIAERARVSELEQQCAREQQVRPAPTEEQKRSGEHNYQNQVVGSPEKAP